MKKFMLIAAVVTLAFTSCVKNDVSDNNEQEIAFNTVAQKNSKAVVYGPIAGTTYPATEHFGVYAYYTATNWATDKSTAPVYMNNVDVSKNGTYWKGTTSYYWPKNGKLTFACYSPYAFGTGTVASTCATGIAFTGFTATNALASQVDLCVTDLIIDQTKQTAVPTPFKHALSQIVFTVAPVATGYNLTSIKVNSITVKTVKSVGNYASTDGTYANGAWSAQSTPISYEVLGGTAATLNLSSTTPVVAGTPIIVIPQACAGYQIDVNYTINYSSTVADTATFTYTIPASSVWAKGTKYTYNIAISVDEILFNPSMTDWTDATGIGVTF